MSHECDECGETFETLTRLRLHDCSATSTASNDSTILSEPDTEPTHQIENQVDEAEIEELDASLDAIRDGDLQVVHKAVATYESALASAAESEGTYSYSDITRTYEKPLVTAVDEATQTRGWSFLEQILDAYPPAGDGEFPHLTTTLQNVTGRYLIRTRLEDGVDAIAVAALEYFASILETVEDHQDFINEGIHPYGWGIGHPDHDVAAHIHDHATRDIFVVNPMLEHAFYADQHAALDLLEQILDDNSVERTMSYPSGEIDETRYLLDAPAGAASGFWPNIPRYWDWHDELGYSFELDAEVERRLREIVVENGLDHDLDPDWDVTDLTL